MSNSNSILIIEGRFYEEIADELKKGAIETLEKRGYSYHVVGVPGALEIPLAVGIHLHAGRIACMSEIDMKDLMWEEDVDLSAMDAHFEKQHVGCIALGCVIRGETSHYDIVANQSAHALMEMATKHGMAIGNGILTVDTAEQARVRADSKGKNKGRDAAQACLSLIDIKKKIIKENTFI